MRKFLRDTWIWLCNLVKVSPPSVPTSNQTSLRDKAIAVAGITTATIDTESTTVSCPVCSTVLQRQDNTDLAMMLAVHLSLRHIDEVMQQWDIMQKKSRPNVHLPSIIAGLGVAAAFGALLAISARNRSHKLTHVATTR